MSVPFKKILIANRGEIARRIARTCRRLGCAVATVHSEADRDAPHVRDVGESILLGPAPASQSYLRIDRIVDAARRCGADAVHPGYGFLSESPALARALADAGIAFIGPSAAMLAAFGDKAAAKRLAIEAGVPTIPGSATASADAGEVAGMVRALGFPALLKAAAGGGGKGIRVLGPASRIDEEIASAMREGLGAFGDPSLLVERFMPDGRHVEVQILGDGRGQVVHLWERECSLQRRHQKVVEEAPALALPAGMRQRMLDAAVALGRHVDYLALGTVEFLVSGDRFHFLEVNPRLQVEHPVTEAVTGLDLVELQIRAAAGQGIAVRQEDVACDGHAIEARLYAEDPDNGFLPSTGVIDSLEFPHIGVRIETGVEAGCVVTSHYDPMIAKLVVGAPTRAAALAAIRHALADTRVFGLPSNLGFLRDLLARPEVVDGTPDTHFIDRFLAGTGAPAAPWRADAGRIAAAFRFSRARSVEAATGVGHWHSLTGWRLATGSPAQALWPQYRLRADRGDSFATVSASPADPDRLEVAIDGATGVVRLRALASDGLAHLVDVDGATHLLDLRAVGELVRLSDGRATVEVGVQPAIQPDAVPAHQGREALVAPLMGKVLEVRVTAGDTVAADDVLVVIESMKMELRVTAPHDGRVGTVQCRAGATVERGALLVELLPIEVDEAA